MEQEWLMANSGFLIDDKLESKDALMEQWRNESTPRDLTDLGYVYCPATDAPLELLKCMSSEESKIVKKFKGREVIILFGGLDGTVCYHGTGLTWLGKEAEASVGQMLASRVPGAEDGGRRTEDGERKPAGGIVELLRQTARFEG